jgi:translation initiation factor 1A
MEEEKLKLPDKSKNEMFAYIVEKTGGGKLRVVCEDGKLRLARIPKKFKKLIWKYYLREGDYIIVQPWEVQGDRFCDVVYKYSETEIQRLKEEGVLPDLESKIPEIGFLD